MVFRIMETIILDPALKFIIQDNFLWAKFKKKKKEKLAQIFNPLKHKVHRKQGVLNRDPGWSPVSPLLHLAKETWGLRASRLGPRGLMRILLLD